MALNSKRNGASRPVKTIRIPGHSITHRNARAIPRFNDFNAVRILTDGFASPTFGSSF